MGIQINGQTDRISAVDGSFSIQDLAEINVTGVATASNFKSGTSNVHSTGYECTNINATGIVTAASANFTGNVSVGGTLTYQDVTNIDSVGVITARAGVVISEDNAIHFRGTAADDADAILRASAGGGQLLVNSRNDIIINIDSNNDSTDAHFAVAHGAATGSSTELLRVQENGNIGIGTDNPDATLKVNVASGNNGVVVQNTSTANIALIGARNGDATVQIGQWGSTASGSTFGLSNADLSFIYTTSYSTTHPSALALGTVSNKPIVFATNNTERLRVTSGGDVQARRARSNTAGDVALSIQPSDSTIHYGFRIDSANNNLNLDRVGTGNFVSITSDGKMGVGTASPNHKLTLHQSGTGTFDALNFTSGLTNSVGLQLGIDSSSNVFFWHTANGAIKFATNNVERMRVFGTDACLQINTTTTPTSGGFQLPQISIKQSGSNWTGGIHIESSGSTKLGCIASTEDGLELSQSYRSGTNYGHILFRTSGTLRAKLLSNGYFQMGSGYLGSTGYHRFNGINDTQGNTFFVLSGYQGSGGSSGDTAIFNSCNTGASTNSSAAAMRIFRNSSTTRSINASGTINASGADYAEYMTKAGNFTLAKGDVCGVNSEGKLTNVFADAISFVVKSTDPSYVGGDKWHEVAGVEPGGYDDTRTEEEIAAAKVVYEEALESARQLVDRIAFSGQVPVNVTGATPGQHIIPTAASDGSIEGTAKAEADLTMAEYMSSVGKVIAIEDDGRARIIVKVA